VRRDKGESRESEGWARLQQGLALRYRVGWLSIIGCLIFLGHFPQKRFAEGPINIGSFAEKHLQFKARASDASSPPCICVRVRGSALLAPVQEDLLSQAPAYSPPRPSVSRTNSLVYAPPTLWFRRTIFLGPTKSHKVFGKCRLISKLLVAVFKL